MCENIVDEGKLNELVWSFCTAFHFADSAVLFRACMCSKVDEYALRISQEETSLELCTVVRRLDSFQLLWYSVMGVHYWLEARSNLELLWKVQAGGVLVWLS